MIAAGEMTLSVPNERSEAEVDLAALVESYGPLLFRVAHSILRSRTEAEDVVQDAFVRVLEHRRTLDPADKVYMTQSRNAISVRADPDDVALVKQLISELDKKPENVYRLTYTLLESDGGKRVGEQHFALLVAAGNHTTLKEGSRVPIVTGSYNHEQNESQTQMTYLDIGLNVDATVDDFSGGVKLRSRVEQSKVAEEKSPVGASDPIVRQSVLEGTSLLTLGKPTVLGALDVPGSTRHLDISVIAEQVK